MRWLVIAALAMGVPACAGPRTPELYLFIWAEYIPEATLRSFEAEHRCRIVETNFGSTDDLVGKLAAGAGGYDLVWPSDDVLPLLVSAGVMDTIDEKKIPNLRNLEDKYRADVKHGVPYLWGTTGIAYNTEKIREKIDSWAALWEPKYKPMSMLDDAREAFAAALRLDAKTADTTDPQAIERARQRLIEQKAFLTRYTSEPRQDLVAGHLWIAQCFNGDAMQAAKEAPVSFVIPKEGATLWLDFMSIPKAAKNKDLAHKFIDYVLRADVGAQIALFRRYATPNAAAMREKGMDELLKDPMVYPPPEDLARCQRLHDIGKARQLVLDAWAQARAK